MRLNNSFRAFATLFNQVPSLADQRDDAADSPIPTMVTPNPMNDQPRELPKPSVPILSRPLDANSWQFVITRTPPISVLRQFITKILFHAGIWANDIATDLGRIPVGFYVIVEAGALQWRTRNKPILVHDRSMEWEDEITL